MCAFFFASPFTKFCFAFFTDLDAMETFHQHQQLQKNILLTICCDRIINDVNFDRFRCAKLALKCLGEWQDNSMNKMSVAICSMLGNYIF